MHVGGLVGAPEHTLNLLLDSQLLCMLVRQEVLDSFSSIVAAFLAWLTAGSCTAVLYCR
jgi:hypothetical protein